MKCLLINPARSCCFKETSFTFLIDKIKEKSSSALLNFIDSSLSEMKSSGAYLTLSLMDQDLFNEFYVCSYRSMVLFSQNEDEKTLLSEAPADFLRTWNRLLSLMREDSRHTDYETAWKEKGLPPEAILSCDHGVVILKKEGKLYARYDTGAWFGEIKEVEISEEDTRLIKKSEKDAYTVILSYEKTGKTRTLPPGQS